MSNCKECAAHALSRVIDLDTPMHEVELALLSTILLGIVSEKIQAQMMAAHAEIRAQKYAKSAVNKETTVLDALCTRGPGCQAGGVPGSSNI